MVAVESRKAVDRVIVDSRIAFTRAAKSSSARYILEEQRVARVTTPAMLRASRKRGYDPHLC